MDGAFWEKVRRYRRIAAFAQDEEVGRQAKRPVRLDQEVIKGDKREGTNKVAAGD